MKNIHTISANLQTMAKELDDATEKSDKLSRKGGKANAQKVDQATARLESASQQWESQAPFIFETLQALDEQRINHLRDVLTQFETHAVDQATRSQAAAEEVLNVMLEVETAREIQNFVQRTTSGKPKIERRSTTRQPTPVTPSAAAPSITGDDGSEHSGQRDNPPGMPKTIPPDMQSLVSKPRRRVETSKPHWHHVRAPTTEHSRRLWPNRLSSEEPWRILPRS